MQFALSHQRQQLIYVSITLIVLALAILMVRWQTHGQNELADHINTHRLILDESGKIKQELAQIHTFLLLRGRDPAQVDRDYAQTNIFGTPFNLSVSLYTLRSRFETLLDLLEKSQLPIQVARKLRSQIGRFEAETPLLLATDGGVTDRVDLQFQGIVLSLEQLEALQNLDYRRLSDELDARIRRDNLVFVGFLLTLVLLSYLLIRLASNRIKSNQDRFTAELEDKNAELERFVYTVSHDLRSPLVSIKGFVGLLQKDIKKNDPQKVLEDADRISHAADDMGDLLEGLLELSRIGRVINPSVSGSLVGLVTRAAHSLQENIEQHGVTLVIDPNMPEFWGDELRLFEVFQNLLENAIKFMGDQKAPRIEITARRDNDLLICAVSDNGTGIEPEYHERIFNLFERLDHSIEGTGIGMSLVKRIVEAHGGTIEVESDGQGKGSTFILTLPLRPQDGAPT